MSELSDLPIVAASGGGLPGNLELGAFSVSLAVADLARSSEFYGRLGFVVKGGDASAGYLILKNGESTLGLQSRADESDGATRELYRCSRPPVQPRGSRPGVDQRADPTTTGPASITLVDPDGNPVLIDQFF